MLNSIVLVKNAAAAVWEAMGTARDEQDLREYVQGLERAVKESADEDDQEAEESEYDGDEAPNPEQEDEDEDDDESSDVSHEVFCRASSYLADPSG